MRVTVSAPTAWPLRHERHRNPPSPGSKATSSTKEPQRAHWSNEAPTPSKASSFHKNAPNSAGEARSSSALRAPRSMRNTSGIAWRSSATWSTTSSIVMAIGTRSRSWRMALKCSIASTWFTTSSSRPRQHIMFTWVKGSRRPARRLLGLRIPLATALTLPCSGVAKVTILSASPSRIVRSTTPSSR